MLFVYYYVASCLCLGFVMEGRGVQGRGIYRPRNGSSWQSVYVLFPHTHPQFSLKGSCSHPNATLELHFPINIQPRSFQSENWAAKFPSMFSQFTSVKRTQAYLYCHYAYENPNLRELNPLNIYTITVYSSYPLKSRHPSPFKSSCVATSLLWNTNINICLS